MPSRTAGVEQRAAARRQGEQASEGRVSGQPPGRPGRLRAGRVQRQADPLPCTPWLVSVVARPREPGPAPRARVRPHQHVQLPIRNLSRSLSGCTTQIHGGLARAGQASAARFPHGSLRCGSARLGRRLDPSTDASSAAGRAAGAVGPAAL